MSVNLGQVAGLHIGNSAPLNNNLIWFDNTPGVNLHKVYDFNSNQWVVLDQNMVVSITYANLVTLSQNQLTIGQWFKITDMGNLMAIALTSTIVQYTNIAGNIVLDDLGNSKQYIVSNNNLTIDNVNGIFNNDRLNFDFIPHYPDPSSPSQNLFGIDDIGGVLTLIKYKLSSLLSNDNNNAISFGSDGGFYLDLTNALSNIYNISGGVVGYDSYINDLNTINNSLNSLNNAISSITNTLTQYVLQQVSDNNIYSKQVPNVNTNIAPSDIIMGDTLQTIVNKTQRYINKLKFATGIDISPNFTDVNNNGWVNNNDTVESAIQKIQYILKNLGYVATLPNNWQPEDYTQHINDLAPLDNFNLAFGKLQGKLNQIGDIENGRIISKNLVTDFNLLNGLLMFSGVLNNLASSGFILNSSTSLGNWGNVILRGEDSVFDYDEPRSTFATGGGSRQVKSGVAVRVNDINNFNNDDIISAFSARFERNNINSNKWNNIFNDRVDIVDAYFPFLKTDALMLKKNYYVANNPSDTILTIHDETFIICGDNQPSLSYNWSIYLPVNDEVNIGRVIFLFVNNDGGNSVIVHGNGAFIYDLNGWNPTTSKGIMSGSLYIFVASRYLGNVVGWNMFKNN